MHTVIRILVMIRKTTDLNKKDELLKEVKQVRESEKK